MDRVERIFGISPDGGDGSFEIAIAVSLLSLAILLFIVVRRRQSSKSLKQL